MLAVVNSCALIGVNGQLVQVEVDASRGKPAITIVGLPGNATKESKDRVWAALRNSGLSFPTRKLTINLAPADIRKDGPAYDLPIAMGLLAASAQIPPDSLDKALVLGELSLDGSVKHVRGVIAAAYLAQSLELERIFVPEEDAPQAAVFPGLEVIPVDHIITMTEHLLGLEAIPAFDRNTLDFSWSSLNDFVDFADVKGQEHVKRALEVAAAGAHNALLTGPPGTGKTLMARAMTGILPEMTLQESLEVTRIYSIADELPEGTHLVQQRPFRAPHHTISAAGLVGGTSELIPGEVSKAHRGVLFLDELPEFGKILDVLRQPIEDRTVTITRASGSATFPSNFMLIASSNPCPCGYYGDRDRECTCSSSTVTRYRQRISGPLADRIDIHVEVPRVAYDKLSDDRRGESSESIRERVQLARDMQAKRFADTNLKANADMGVQQIASFCKLASESETLMRSAMQQMQLSARGYHRVLKLSRTIADMETSDLIRSHHIAEALQYRAKQFWG